MSESTPPKVYRNNADDAIAARVKQLLESQPRVILAIDGNCCAGKTTAAAQLGELLHANVFHMDDYFLQPHMRTPDRLDRPGGNVDAGRFFLDILLPASRGETAHVRRYDCHEDILTSAIRVDPTPVVIVEGAYSMHPLLATYYHIKIFYRLNADEQLERIRVRNGEDAVSVFQNRWIPLENGYFNAYQIEQHCDFVVDTSNA